MIERMRERERDNVSATKKGRAQRAIVRQKKRDLRPPLRLFINVTRSKRLRKKEKERNLKPRRANCSLDPKERTSSRLSHLSTTNDGEGAVLNASGRSKHVLFCFMLCVRVCIILRFFCVFVGMKVDKYKRSLLFLSKKNKKMCKNS
jgi:hypothetical protein